MTHRQVIALAARLSEHSPEIIRGSQHIRLPALRRYLKGNQTRFQVWSALLLDSAPAADGKVQLPRPTEEPDNRRLPPGKLRQEWRESIRPILLEISSTGVLLRVMSTLLHAIGEQQDIPLAMDIARHTAEAYTRTTQAAMAALALRPGIPIADLTALNRVGRVCDRLTDLLCGAMSFHSRCNRFVVDAARAGDFAETFGRFPALVRLPIQKAASMFHGKLALTELGDEIELAIFDCLPAATRLPLDGDVADLVRRGFAPLEESSSSGSSSSDREPAPVESTTAVSFPTCSFARQLQRLGARTQS